MDIAITLQECGLQSALIIDDAYELPSSGKLSAESKTKFVKSIRDEDARAVVLRRQFSALDTEADDQLIGLLENNSSVVQIWNLYRDNAEQFGWCKDTFAKFEDDLALKRIHLLALEEFLKSKGVVLHTRATIPDETIIDSFGLVFIDFFLVEESADDALRRSVEIGKKFAVLRKIGEKRFRPLVFLISSRAETTRRYQEQFRNLSKIKGSFFRFIEKENLANDQFPARLERQLLGYQSSMLLADYLDAFRDGASAAIDSLQELELTDLSLLNYLRIEGENERLGNYLNWLLSEAISGGVQSDDRIRKAAADLDSRVNQTLDGHIIEPRNILFEIYTKAIFRYDVRDHIGQERSNSLAFGDVFVPKQQTEGQAIAEFIAVLTPSSDIIRERDDGKHVLCVIGNAVGTSKEDITDLLGVDLKGHHIIETEGDGKKAYKIIKWNAKHLRTIALKEMNDIACFTRLARLQPLFAHQLSEVVLRDLGRVGVPTTPSILKVLNATVSIKIDQTLSEFKAVEKAIFSAVRAIKRIDQKEQEVVCFTLAFVDELKKFASGLRGVNHQDDGKLGEVIRVCENGELASVPTKDKEVFSVGSRIKIFLGEQKDDESGFCNIVLKSIDP